MYNGMNLLNQLNGNQAGSTGTTGNTGGTNSGWGSQSTPQQPQATMGTGQQLQAGATAPTQGMLNSPAYAGSMASEPYNPTFGLSPLTAYSTPLYGSDAYPVSFSESGTLRTPTMQEIANSQKFQTLSGLNLGSGTTPARTLPQLDPIDWEGLGGRIDTLSLPTPEVYADKIGQVDTSLPITEPPAPNYNQPQDFSTTFGYPYGPDVSPVPNPTQSPNSYNAFMNNASNTLNQPQNAWIGEMNRMNAANPFPKGVVNRGVPGLPPFSMGPLNREAGMAQWNQQHGGGGIASLLRDKMKMVRQDNKQPLATRPGPLPQPRNPAVPYYGGDLTGRPGAVKEYGSQNLTEAQKLAMMAMGGRTKG